MKKSILPLLFTSALLAACTNNDFEQIQTPNEVENGLLKGRAKGEIVLNAEKSNENQASTRVVGDMDGDAINWMWENAQDKLGAVVVDYADNNGIVDLEHYPTYAITNYPFAPDIQGPSASAEFSTPTAVVSGAYMFYNRYDGKATARRTISHSIERILKVDAGKEAGLSQVGTAENGGQNFFISPIVDLAIADGENIAKPISMTSTYSVLHFKLQSDTKDYYEKGFKVNKIVLKAMDGEFQRNLTIDPAEVAKIQKNIAKDPAYATYFRSNGAIDAMNLSDEQIGEALRLVNAEIANPNNSIGVNKENATSTDLVYQLNEPFVFKNKDQVLDLMVIVPSATYKNAKGETFEGVSEGVFLVTVYTSEGIYNTYVAAEKDKTTRTLMRGKKYNVPRTMIIDGGRTNVTLFDQAEGFDIETTEDYEYAIEYINDHYRDYGDGNEWTVPELRLVDGKEIEVDAEHFFPNFPVLYKGNAKLVLVGQKDYVLDPTTAIFATGNDRPTIVIKDDAASLSFKGDVCTGIKDFYGKAGKDGVNVTCAYKVVSDAAIKINAVQKVDFDLLESNTSLTVGEGAEVNANGNAVKTGKYFLLDKKAKFNVAKVWNNSAETSILPEAVLTAQSMTNAEGTGVEIQGTVKLTAATASQNDGNIRVWGKLNAQSFKNAGELQVMGWDENIMNDNTRAEATFTATLTNTGKLIITKSADKKGTYGGLVSTKELVNDGTIEDNGELKAESMNNTGVLNLMEDPYALIQIQKGASTEDGKIVLTTPAEYEMYDSYYSQRNSLKNVDGIIEATINQETYDKVLKNLNASELGNQERAWQVINKVIVAGKVAFTAENGNTVKDFVLPEGSEFSAKENVTLASLTIEGTSTLSTTLKNVTVNVNKNVDVQAKAALTVAKEVNMIIKNAASTMLNVAGTLTNNGTINTVPSSTVGQPNKINTFISGTLTNNGFLSQPSEYVYDNDAYQKLDAVLGKLYDKAQNANSYYRGFYANLTPRVDVINSTVANIASAKWNNENTWNTNTTNDASNYVQKAEIINLLKSGSLVDVEGYQAIAVNHMSGYSFVLYLGAAEGDEYISPEEFATWKAIAKKNASLITDKGAMGENLTTAKTWFYVTENRGTLDLTKGQAWGEIAKGMNKGTKIGDFENDK